MEKNWRLHHIAVVVEDVDKAVEYFESKGIGTAGHVLKPKITRFVNIGPVSLELMQPVKGDPVREEFLGGQTEGLHHITFAVDDLDEEIAKLEKKGLPAMTKERPIGVSQAKPRAAGSPRGIKIYQRGLK